MKIIDPIITSRKNRLVIDTAALSEKKHREATCSFLIEGEKLVCEAAEHALPVFRLFVAESKKGSMLPKLERAFSSPVYRDTEVYILADDCFLKISSEKAPQGVIAVLKYLDFFKRTAIIYDEDVLSLQNKRAVMLYDVQDPGNLGAVIRSAVAFGVDCLLLSPSCADLYGSKTVRAAMGSLFSVSAYVVEDVGQAIGALRRGGRRVLAAELRDGALPIASLTLSASDCMLIGNEGHGIPAEISALCDYSVYLPISRGAESLNAAVAASVLLWEQSKVD
ncbi:MAG: RNA methyltransferase [Clostridia bacterium]|nr:RNA methyltransferase [Clostridia bacterium]